MEKNILSKEFVKELKEHKYVENATEWTVNFTEEFKQLAYDEYHRGKSTKEIFEEAENRLHAQKAVLATLLS